jgi:biopolymer transport protein ExbD
VYNWDEEPDLNITPFVDVMLVLMAILMVTAPTITYEEKIDLPDGTQSKVVTKESVVTIVMDKNRVISLYKDGKKIDSYKSLANFRDNFMLKSKNFNPNTVVFVRADKKLIYEDVMGLLKAVKDVGFAKASLITQ